MLKFEKGDMIKLVGKKERGWNKEAEPGMKGTVIDPNVCGELVAIDLDGIPRHHGIFGEGWYYFPEELELVKEGD